MYNIFLAISSKTICITLHVKSSMSSCAHRWTARAKIKRDRDRNSPAIENAGIKSGDSTRNAAVFCVRLQPRQWNLSVIVEKDRRGFALCNGRLQRPDYVRRGDFIKICILARRDDSRPRGDTTVVNPQPPEKFRNGPNRTSNDASRKRVRDWWWWNQEDYRDLLNTSRAKWKYYALFFLPCE